MKRGPASSAIRTAVALAVLAPAIAWSDATIVIVRHGEKPPQGLGQLTCRGLNRSLALAPLLWGRYGRPVAVYAPNPAFLKLDHGKAYAYVRPLATIEPLAIRAGLPVTLDWGMDEIEPLADRLLETPDGTQVVAWEHHWAEALARRLVGRLGGDPGQVPRWPDDDFDSVFVIRVVAGGDGRQASFTHERQGLEGLPEACGDGPVRVGPRQAE